MNVGKLLETVDSLVPLNSAFEDDFVGITIGSKDSEVNGLAVAHEIEHSILDYSISNNINTLITYHPPPLQKVFDEDGTEFFEDDTLTSKFRKAGINIITVHTAQDVCKGGNADSLVDLFDKVLFDLETKKYDLVFVHTLVPHKPYGFNKNCQYDGKKSIVLLGSAATDQDILKLVNNLNTQKLVQQASLGSMNLPKSKAGSNTKKRFQIWRN